MFGKKREGESRSAGAMHESLISNQTNVGMIIANHLFSSLSKEESEKNIVFSPVSIYVALSMVAAGSNGPTRDQILSFLNSNSTDHLNSLASHLSSSVLYSTGDDAAADTNRDSYFYRDPRYQICGPLLNFVNGLWIDRSYTLNASFESVARNDYNAVLSSVDFRTKFDEVRMEVNSWVKKETKGTIDNVLPAGSVDNLTGLVFANALYFSAFWENSFSRSSTKDFEFHVLNGTSVKVPFLVDNSHHNKFLGAFDGFKVLCLPYEKHNDKRRFSMYIFLPDVKDGLSTLIEKTISEPGFLEHNIPKQKVEAGNIRIPKFNFSFEIDISKCLKEMGLVLPFSQVDADLSEMVHHNVDEDPYISVMVQKSFIELDEKGTKVAAASVGVLRIGCLPPIPTENAIDFVADHPFLFVIREDLTKTVLFIGLMLNPLVTGF